MDFNRGKKLKSFLSTFSIENMAFSGGNLNTKIFEPKNKVFNFWQLRTGLGCSVFDSKATYIRTIFFFFFFYRMLTFSNAFSLKMQFLLNIFNNAFSRHLIRRVSHCQGNSRGSREELWKRFSCADSREQLGSALDPFNPGRWQWLVLSEAEEGQGCGRAPSPLLQGEKAKKGWVGGKRAKSDAPLNKSCSLGKTIEKKQNMP